MSDSMKSCILDDFREASCVDRSRTRSAEVRAVQSRREPTGATGKFFVTPHAVHKYQREVRPNASYNQALSDVITLTNAGRFVADYSGHTLAERFPGTKLELWRGPTVGTKKRQRASSRMRFVVAYGEGDKPQVISVLPRGR